MYITGTITLPDGSASNFSIGKDGGWQQWGAHPERLGETVEVLEAMTNGLLEAGLMMSEDEEGEEDL